jgi:hypothetical protein
MTDGEATDGSNDAETLKLLVDSNVMNAFIGFGIQHDAGLLNSLGSVGKCSYHFIDKLESAGFVYGEILHSVIYKVLIDCEIKATNGLLYDFKTNTWVDSLKIGDIISEANKTYNIISEHPDIFTAVIQGTMENLVVLYPSRRLKNTDLSKHLFRQRTLQLMFEVNQYCNKKRENDRILTQVNDFNNITLLKDELKQNLTTFMNEMKLFMNEKNLTDDKFMKNLCDDIYICFKTFDTRYGNMFCSARQSSQGAQRQYSVSNTFVVENENTFNMLKKKGVSRQRQHNGVVGFNLNGVNMNDNILPILQHEISNFDDTPYLTPQATQVMRFVNSSKDEQEDTV